jgi:predicted enzyme related to lactoylglutathione lyase
MALAMPRGFGQLPFLTRRTTHEAGDEVVTKDEWNDPAVGRFARVHDPEGNPIELWEPPLTAA